MLVADNRAYYASEAQQLFTFLGQDPDGLGLQQLQLAGSGELQPCSTKHAVVSPTGLAHVGTHSPWFLFLCTLSL